MAGMGDRFGNYSRPIYEVLLCTANRFVLGQTLHNRNTPHLLRCKSGHLGWAHRVYTEDVGGSIPSPPTSVYGLFSSEIEVPLCTRNNTLRNLHLAVASIAALNRPIL